MSSAQGPITIEAFDAVVRCLADLLAFLELSDESVVDADAAVQAMEDAAHTLQSMAPLGRREVVSAILRLANEDPQHQRSTFLGGLPDALGLA